MNDDATKRRRLALPSLPVLPEVVWLRCIYPFCHLADVATVARTCRMHRELGKTKIEEAIALPVHILSSIDVGDGDVRQAILWMLRCWWLTENAVHHARYSTSGRVDVQVQNAPTLAIAATAWAETVPFQLTVEDSRSWSAPMHAFITDEVINLGYLPELFSCKEPEDVTRVQEYGEMSITFLASEDTDTPLEGCGLCYQANAPEWGDESAVVCWTSSSASDLAGQSWAPVRALTSQDVALQRLIDVRAKARAASTVRPVRFDVGWSEEQVEQWLLASTRFAPLAPVLAEFSGTVIAYVDFGVEDILQTFPEEHHALLRDLNAEIRTPGYIGSQMRKMGYQYQLIPSLDPFVDWMCEQFWLSSDAIVARVTNCSLRAARTLREQCLARMRQFGEYKLRPMRAGLLSSRFTWPVCFEHVKRVIALIRR